MDSKFKKVKSTFLEYSISIGLFVIIWQIYVTAAKVPEYMLPSPGAVFKQLVSMVSEGGLWLHFSVTSGEVFSGFLAGSLLGFIAGYILVKIPLFEEALMPYILLAQTAPKVALVPLFVIWFGLGFTSKLILVISMVFFPVMVGTILGVKSVNKDIKNLMKVLNASKLQILTQIEIPSSLPMIFSGLKIGMVQAVIGAIVAEWISGKSGLGYLLVYGSTTYDTPLMIAGIIITIVVGIIFYELVEVLENKYLYWHESKQFNRE